MNTQIIINISTFNNKYLRKQVSLIESPIDDISKSLIH